MARCDASQTLKIRPIGWSRRVEAGVKQSATPQEVAWQKRRYEAGEIQPVGLYAGGDLAWTAVVWSENGPNGPELVVCGAAGHLGKTVDATVANAFEQYAREHSARLVRFHTVRPGFARVAMALGFRTAEFVLTKAVA